MTQEDAGGAPVETPFRRVEVRAPTARLIVRDYTGGGEPVLLLHGGPGCPDYLGPVAKLLLPYHRVLTFDQRGVGSSAALNGRYQVDDYLADIEAIREHLGIERLHVFGHSWGGLLAQLYAHAYPARVRSLFLCNSALGVGEGWQRNQCSGPSPSSPAPMSWGRGLLPWQRGVPWPPCSSGPGCGHVYGAALAIL